MKYESIKSFSNVKYQSKDHCMAICPCHDDKNASLSISYCQSSKKTLIYCHTGCDARGVLNLIGLRIQDLFDEGSENWHLYHKMKYFKETIDDKKVTGI